MRRNRKPSTGQNKSTKASTIKVETSPLDQKIDERPFGHDHRLPEGVLGLVAEHHGEHERRDRVVELLEHIADTPKAEHEPEVEVARAATV